MANVYIAAYQVVAGRQHAYLVYDPNEDVNSTSDQLIIRGGPQTPGILPPFGAIIVEAGAASDVSLDGLDNIGDLDGDGFLNNDKIKDGVADRPDERSYTSYDVLSADAWDVMVSYASELINTQHNYNPLGPNSNSVINTVLNIAGINFRDVLPTGFSATEFPGHLDLLDVNSDNLFTAYIYDDGYRDATHFYKAGGNDVILIEWNNATDAHAELVVFNEQNSRGLTTIYMDGLNFSDVVFSRSSLSNDLNVKVNGNQLVEIDNFYLDRGSLLSDSPAVTAFEFQDVYYRLGDARGNVLDASDVDRAVYLDGWGGNDTLIGGSGNDVLKGGAGDDQLYGGFGQDTADYSKGDPSENSGGITVNLNRFGNGSVRDQFNDIDTLNSIEAVIATSADDIFSLTGVANRMIDGADGIDTASYLVSPITVTIGNFSDQGFDVLVTDGNGNKDSLKSIERIIGQSGVNNTIIFSGNGEVTELSPNKFIFQGREIWLENFTIILGDEKDQQFRLLPVDGRVIDGGSGSDFMYLSHPVIINGSAYVARDGTFSSEFLNIEGISLGAGENIIKTENGESGVWIHASSSDRFIVTEQIWVSEDKITNADGDVISESGLIVSTNAAMELSLGSGIGSGSYKGDGDVVIKRTGNVYDFLSHDNNAWLNYSEYQRPLEFYGHVYDSALPSGDAIDRWIGVANIIGTNRGDNIFLSEGDNIKTFWSGLGDDTIQVSSNTEIIYSGGDDVLFGREITLAPGISISSIDRENLEEGYWYTGYYDANLSYHITEEFYSFRYDLQINLTGGGSILIPGMRTDFSYGADQIKGTADDILITRSAANISLWSGRYYEIDEVNFSLNGNGTRSSNVPTPYDDVLTGDSGGSGDDILNGGGGNDTISAGAGDDIVYGGTGHDHLIGGFGNDTIFGGSGNDSVVGGEGHDLLHGDGGDDMLRGGSGDDVLFGGSGNDIIYGDAGNDIIDGGEGDDIVYGGSGDDHITDLFGNNILSGGEGVDRYTIGGNGLTIIRDVDAIPEIILLDKHSSETMFRIVGDSLELLKTGNNDVFMRVDGLNNLNSIDTQLIFTDESILAYQLWYMASEDADVIELMGSGMGAYVDALSGDDYLSGSSFSDVIFGGSGNDFIIGNDGDDILHGGLGDDTFLGGAGDDVLIGGAGNDSYIFSAGGGIDRIVDNEGINYLYINGGIDPSSLIYSRIGNDLSIHIASGVLIEGYFLYETTVSQVVFDGQHFFYLDDLVQESGHINDTPVARDDVFSVLINQTVSGNVLTDNGSGADSDLNDNTLFVIPAEIITSGGGSLLLLSNGNFIYTPAASYTGADSFDYVLSDGRGGVDTGTVFINVQPLPNVAPVAQDDGFVAAQGVLLSGNLLDDNGNGVDFDADGDALLVASGSFITDAGGVIEISSDGSFIYAAPANYAGTDSFTYTLSDGQGGVDTASAFFNVLPPLNNAPVAQDDSFTAPQDTSMEGNLLVDNGHGVDFDLDSDTLSLVHEIKSSAQGGSVIIMANGDFTYMPPADYVGEDSFDYTLVDGKGGSDVGSVNLTMTPVVTDNHDPVAEDDSFATVLMQSVSGNVLDNDSDPDGNPLTVQQAAIMTAAGGLVTLLEDGSFTYTPMSGFIGIDSFDYTVLDGQGGHAIGSVSISVTATACAVIGTNHGEAINGTKVSDTILGMDGNDTIKGKQGTDKLFGGNGNDKLYGDDGNDLLIGGAGNDTLEGGKGNDILIGGDVYMDIPLFGEDNILFPSLKETKNINHLAPPGTAALGMVAGDLSSDTPRDATITFIGTGAGYNNSLGVYNVAADGTILNVSLAFENVKDYRAGDAIDVTLPGSPDSDFGFFIISDGARQNNEFRGLDLDSGTLSFWYDYGQAGQRQASIHDDGDRVSLVFSDGSHDTVIKGSVYHTTERGGSTDINVDEANHVVSGFVDEHDKSTLRIGFEDLTNLGDADYNDVVFDLSYKPIFIAANTPDGVDTLKGGDGNDLLIGGSGNDILYGGKGADTFKYLGGDEGTDRIKDFSLSEGDRIDISDVLIDDFDPVADMISQFVQITKQGKDSVLSVDVDGAANGSNYTALAIIESGCNLDLVSMIENGNLVL